MFKIVFEIHFEKDSLKSLSTQTFRLFPAFCGLI